MNRLLLFVSLLMPLFVLAQDEELLMPDYKQIKLEISDSSSPNYYPNLFSRFQEGDSTLTEENFKHLYFGYVFNDKYNPYETLPCDDSLAHYYRKDDLSTKDLKKVIVLLEKNLASAPFDLGTMDVLAYCYDIDGRNEDLVKMMNNMTGLVDAILNSGDGLSTKTAWHVISLSHEYDLIDILQFNFGGEQSLVDGPCDYLTIESNSYGFDGFFFNVSKPMEYLNEVLK